MNITEMCLTLILICFIEFVQSYGQMKENQDSMKFGNVYISAAAPNSQISLNYPPFYGPRLTYDSLFTGYFGPINQLYYLPAYKYLGLTGGSLKSANENKVKPEVTSLQFSTLQIFTVDYSGITDFCL